MLIRQVNPPNAHVYIKTFSGGSAKCYPSNLSSQLFMQSFNGHRSVRQVQHAADQHRADIFVSSKVFTHRGCGINGCSPRCRSAVTTEILPLSLLHSCHPRATVRGCTVFRALLSQMQVQAERLDFRRRLGSGITMSYCTPLLICPFPCAIPCPFPCQWPEQPCLIFTLLRQKLEVRLSSRPSRQIGCA